MYLVRNDMDILHEEIMENDVDTSYEERNHLVRLYL
jgi:hypothetical protein